MQYRRLGRTGRDVSVVGFGAGPLQVVDPDEAADLVRRALDGGINIIDVDKVHPEGETKVGRALEGRCEEMCIISKSFADTESEMRRDLEDSLEKLQASYINVYQLHQVRDAADWERRSQGPLRALRRARDEGLIHHIGISSHHPPTLERAIKSDEFDVALIPYNLGHTLARSVFDAARAHDVGLMTMKPLGGGFLVDPRYGDKEGRPEARQMTAANALRFVLAEEAIHCALVGINRPEQVDEAVAIACGDLGFSPGEAERLDALVREILGDDYCRTCKYCLPCANEDKLEIDEVLRLKGFFERYGYEEVPRIIYSRKFVTALACVECGSCEERCPYDIPIREHLRAAHELLKSDEEPDLVSRAIDCQIDRRWNDEIAELRLKENYRAIVELARPKLLAYPNNSILLSNLGEALVALGEPDEGLPYLHKLFELKDDYPSIRMNLGKAYFEKEELETALAEFDAHLLTGPDEQSVFRTWYYKAMISHRTEREEELKEAIEKIRSFPLYYKKTENFNERKFHDEVIGPRTGEYIDKTKSLKNSIKKIFS